MEDDCVTIPLIEPHSLLALPKADPRMHALLIDEEEQVLDHLRSMLRHEAFEVSAFMNTNDAFEILQQGLRPDIAFIDPRVTGPHDLPALKWMRHIRPTVPTIALCCSFNPRVIVDAVNMGAIDVLVQPFDQADLKSSLKRCRLT